MNAIELADGIDEKIGSTEITSEAGMTIDLKAIRATAEAATPGPWEAVEKHAPALYELSYDDIEFARNIEQAVRQNAGLK